MIKKIFLTSKSKKGKSESDHGTYSSSNRIGILYNVDEFDPRTVSELVVALKEDQKNVSLMGFKNSPLDKAELDDELFTKKDISAVGSIKKDSVLSFVNENFDFLISLDTSGNINYKYILSQSKAVCKVGFEVDSYRDHLTLTMYLSENKPTSIKHLLSYLRKI